MRVAHGAELLMALPVFRAEVIDHFVVLVEWRGEYVTAEMTELSDRQWYWGHYFSEGDRTRAVVDAYMRADVHVMPWESIAAPVPESVEMKEVK